MEHIDISKFCTDLKDIDVESIDTSIFEGESFLDACNRISKDVVQKMYISDDYSKLAARIMLEPIAKSSPATFSDATKKLKSALNASYFNFVMENSTILDAMIDHSRDNSFNYYGMNILRDTFLMSYNKKGHKIIVERPQYMYLRVACFLYYDDKDVEASLETIKTVYDNLSTGMYSHATPTLLNSGKKEPQLASCFTVSIKDDTIQALTDSWHWTAIISKYCGGIGMDFSNLRHSALSGGGVTKGIVPWVKIYEQVLQAVDQGGIRAGSGAVYLCDWHIDVESFLELRLPVGDENARARTLFYGLMISDEFMRRVRDDEDWTLFCPTSSTKRLENLWGTDFEMEYRMLEREADAGNVPNFKKISARSLFKKLIHAQQETGMPYTIYKDTINRKSNQKNLGTTKLSNLCSEITLFTDKDNIGSCNLASIVLSKCVDEPDDVSETPTFNFDRLGEVTRELVSNINQVIDRNYYPDEIPQIKYTNLRNRPLGIGVQDLAGVFAKMDMSWESPEAKVLNAHIFETMYYHATDESVKLAMKYGKYDTFDGSPASEGKLQPDLWREEIDENKVKYENYTEFKFTESRYTEDEWDELKSRVKEYGMRNSLLFALMPTATSSKILNSNDSFEPYAENIFTKVTLAGQFLVINHHFMNELKKCGLWNTEFVREVWKTGGSLQNVECPEGVDADKFKHLQQKYKTIFEIPQRTLIDMAIDRGRFVCQSQSFNYWNETPQQNKLYNYHLYAWKNGMKGGYYIRRKPPVSASNFSINSLTIPSSQESHTSLKEEKQVKYVCTEEVCTSCQA